MNICIPAALAQIIYAFLVAVLLPGDMLSVDGDADAAVEARIRIGWNKFRQLVPLLTNIGRVSDYEMKVVHDTIRYEMLF